MRVQKVRTSSNTLNRYVNGLPPKEYKGISPSQLGGCMRSHYWKIKGEKPSTPPTTAAKVNFLVGHAWEATLAEAYRAEGTLVKHFDDKNDEPFKCEETGIVGLPDLLIKEGDELVIVDSKTVNSKYFMYANRYKKFEDWVESNYQYIYQQVAYVHLLRSNGYEVDSAILSFASKDDGIVGLEFRVEVTEELLNKVLARAKRLQDYIKNNQLPPCECEGWKVGYCDFGNPDTRQPNRTKKIVNTECCKEAFIKKGEQQWLEIG